MNMNSTKHHVAVWLDHQEARVFRIGPDGFDESTLKNPAHHVRRHPDKNAAGSDHPDDAKHFFHAISTALFAADEILVVGPSTAKLHFIKYVHAHAPELEKHIIGVESVDHPTDGQMATFARKYFIAVDRVLAAS